MNRDLVTSIIRTWCALLIGALASWLAKYGVDLDVETTSIVVGGLVTGVLYALVRIVELRWPAVGILLGIRKAPSYTPAPAADPNATTASSSAATVTVIAYPPPPAPND